MNKEVLEKITKQKTILIPLLCFQNYKALNVNLEEFIFLMYLKDKGDTFIFNPSHMAEELGQDLMSIMKLISSLTDKKLLLVEAYKNEKNVMEERLNLEGFYDKYSLLLMEKINQTFTTEKVEDSTIFENIEKEFGRTLNPSEVEFIKAWLVNFKEEIIKEAVKEAILNGVSSIRYIDKILYEWDKKGIKTKGDVEHFLKSRKKEIKEPLEVFDYDWFDEDDDID